MGPDSDDGQDNIPKKCIRVLIVDDIAQVRQGLATVLLLSTKKLGQKIEVIGEAENGREAITQVERLHPDVVLMDLEMPGGDGYEATRQIKVNQPAIRVIILSIHAGREEIELAYAAGADGFICKDNKIGTLLDAILVLKSKSKLKTQINGGKNE